MATEAQRPRPLAVAACPDTPVPSQGDTKGDADLVAQLMIMIEQTALDGKSDLGWLMTLQHDPPSSVFLDPQALPASNLRPFSPLCHQRLVTTIVAFVKELDA